MRNVTYDCPPHEPSSHTVRVTKEREAIQKARMSLFGPDRFLQYMTRIPAEPSERADCKSNVGEIKRSIAQRY